MELIAGKQLTDALTDYFSVNYSCPVSYYNAFSCMHFSDKLQRRYQISKVIHEHYYFLENQLLLLITGETETIAAFIAPRSKELTEKLCAFIRAGYAAKVIVLVPDFLPSPESFTVARSYSQVLYDCSRIPETINKDIEEKTGRILNSRSCTSFNKNNRECTLMLGGPEHVHYFEEVQSEWQRVAEKKGIDTGALRKDRICFSWLENRANQLTCFIGLRGEKPVSYTFLTRLPFKPEVASLLATKSLNYREQAGGYNETAVWELYRVCIEAEKLGIRFINASGTNNGDNLSRFKDKFRLNSNYINSHDYEYRF